MAEDQYYPKAPTSPEYLQVFVTGAEGKEVDVFIEDNWSGVSGQVIQATRGQWEVSVDWPGTHAKVVNLLRTTYKNPLVVHFP